jgi:hypothetical protein
MERLKRLYEDLPEFWPSGWTLRHDDAPAHKALFVKQFLSEKIYYGNGTFTLPPSFGSEWLVAAFRNKVYLKATKISGY